MVRGDIRIFNDVIHVHRYLKSIVYGGLDGIITTFAVVAGVAGAALGSNIVLILGFANLIADGISMAIGDFLSTRAYLEMRPSTKKALPLKNAFATFISFLIFGFIPLMAYVVSLFYPLENLFEVSIGLTGFALFILGSLKYRITGRHWLRSGFEMLIIGGIAASAAYFIGAFIASVI